MITSQLIRHEILMTGKLTCFTFAIQTSLQFLPFVPSWMTPWIWLLTSVLVVAGLKSDAKFYAKCTDSNLAMKRIMVNLLLCLLSWLLTLRSFLALRIPLFQEEDKDMAEAKIPDLERKLLTSKIFDEFGEVQGLVMLLVVHLSSVGTLVTMVKLGMLILEVSLSWLGTVKGKLFPVDKKPTPKSASRNAEGKAPPETLDVKENEDNEEEEEGKASQVFKRKISSK